MPSATSSFNLPRELEPAIQSDVHSIEVWLANALPTGIRTAIRAFDHEVPVKGREKREMEFATGRQLARQLLKSHNAAPTVGVASDRSPVWPDGTCGSISHSSDFAWVTVASSERFRSLGIDTEPVANQSTVEQLSAEVATIQEWNILRPLGLDRETEFTIAFSAKESFYKCLYPLTHSFLEFQDVRIRSASQSHISIELIVDSQKPNRIRATPTKLDVYWHLVNTHVFTATCIPQSAMPSQEIK